MQNKKKKNLEEAAIKTMAFFDLFDYPLILSEIWQWGLWPERITLDEVSNLLEVHSIKDKIEQKNGFYYLTGREKIVATRLKRYNYAIRKIKRLHLVVRLFKIIPWIRLAAIGNIIGASNLKDESDIDVFIVAERKRVWLTRFFCASLMAALNLRPKPGQERDKICLNFYVSKDNLDLRILMLPGKHNELSSGYPKLSSLPKDIYFVYWLACLMPIYDQDNTYEKLIEANQWLFKTLPNWTPILPVHRLAVSTTRLRLYDEIFDLFIGGLEPEVKKYQLNKMPPKIKSKINKGTRVAVDDNTIKLHSKDRRREYYLKWLERINEVNTREIKSENEHILELASVL